MKGNAHPAIEHTNGMKYVQKIIPIAGRQLYGKICLFHGRGKMINEKEVLTNSSSDWSKHRSLLIVSTYGPNAVDDWLAIQQHFISKYTNNYKFAVWTHNLDDESMFDYVLGTSKGDLLYALPEMFHQIYYACRNLEYKYDDYLILDSDCFPVKEGWKENLLDMMGDRWYAAPVRTDNLDTVPHPCALFIRGEYINEHLFFFRRPSVGRMTNLLGEEVHDIGTGFKTEVDGKPVFFPLIRSNYLSPNPILASIYGDTFYHHGAGSRTPWFRSTPYWKKVIPDQYNKSLNCYEDLKKDPEGFVSKLRVVG
jgi:hypothetical protein